MVIIFIFFALLRNYLQFRVRSVGQSMHLLQTKLIERERERELYCYTSYHSIQSFYYHLYRTNSREGVCLLCSCDRAGEQRAAAFHPDCGKKKEKRRADSCPCQRMQKKRGIDLKPDAVLLLFLLPLEIPRHLGSVSPEMNSFLNPFLPFFLGASIETGGFILEKRCAVVFFGVALSLDGLRRIWRGKKNENPFSFWVSWVNDIGLDTLWCWGGKKRKETMLEFDACLHKFMI